MKNNFLDTVRDKLVYGGKRIKYVVLQEKYPMLNLWLRQKAIDDGALGVVLMLHRVADYDKHRLPPNEALKVSPAFLQNTIDKYKKAGFLFLSLNDVYDILIGKRTVDRPFVSFTMDDGYLDNFTKAYPIFKRNKVPFCLFLATDFIDKKAILWWFSIEDLILNNSHIKLTDGSSYVCDSFQNKWSTFRLLRERILHLDQYFLLKSLQQLFSYYEVDWLAPVKSMTMSWDNIKSLSNEPLCTIGGHTISHPAFNQISLEKIKQEIDGGIKKIENATGIKVKHFAYPYGSINENGEREYKFLQQFGFKTVFVSYGGIINKENINSMTHLPRFMLQK